MGSHSKTTVCPTNELHGGSIRDKMLKIASTAFQEPFLQKLFLVITIKDLLHGCPVTLLPLEDSLFSNNVRSDLGLKTSLEENMRQLSDIVVGVVVHDHHVVVVGQISFIDDKRRSTVLGKVGGQQGTLSDFIPAGTVLSSYSMTFKKNLVLVTEFNTLDMNGITRNGNTVPSTTHSTVGGSKGLGKSKFFDLKRRGRDGRFFKDGPNTCTSFYGIMKDFVVGLVTAFARQIVDLPGARVEVGFDPLIDKQITCVMGHLLSRDVDHGRCRNILTKGDALWLWGSTQVASQWSKVGC
mmetsp:Transcript_14299/g.23113  ORF Transcript_14299/g.23113 Transcript_14299/m.23113 type:complete len:296 (-) Transcript_14299:299-1186(-)